jgi:flavodoxin
MIRTTSNINIVLLLSDKMDSKTIVIIAAIAVVVACVGAALFFMNNGGNSDTPVDPEPVFPDLNENVLLMYFSATEVTAGVAETMSDYLGCDIVRIEPEVPYTPEDLQRDDPNSRVSKENQDPKCRPAIAGDKVDISKYSTIILGFPIWYHKEPKIIDTFLDAYDLSGKNVVPFCTSWSAGIAGAMANIGAAEPDAKVIYGTDFQADDPDEQITKWLDSIGFKKKTI